MSGFLVDLLTTSRKDNRFGQLPASPSAGMLAYISDGSATSCSDGACTTFGAAVTAGGGSLPLLIWWNGAAWTLIGKASGIAGGRTILAANTTFFVRTTGNDSNNGLAAGTAWLTLQHALTVVGSSYDLAGFTATIDVGAGTFAGAGTNGAVGSGAINISGAGTGVTHTTITAGPNDGVINFGECFDVNISPGATFFQVNNLIIKPANGNYGFVCYAPGATCYVANVAFDLTNTPGILISVQTPATLFTATLTSTATTITVGAGTVGNAYFVGDGGCIQSFSAWTLTGTPTFTVFAAVGSNSSIVEDILDSSYTGAATGARYQLAAGGTVISSSLAVGALGPNFYPGNTAGTADATSCYDGLLGANVHYNIPITGFTLTMANADTDLILDPAGTLATGTVKMAASPIDAQKITIRSSQIITTLTINGNGNTVVGAPTTIGVGGVLNAIFKASNTTWYF